MSWFRDAARGSGLEPLRATIRLLQSAAFWQSIGLTCQGDPVLLGKLSEEHPAVAGEDEVFTKVAGLGMALVKTRCQSLGWHTPGYPGSFAGLLDIESGQKVLDKMKADYVVWQRWQQQDDTFWRKLAKRCPMQLTVCQLVFTMAKECNWELQGRLQILVAKLFSGITQTKLVEDAMRVERTAEVSRGFNRK
eukprot:5976545-Heterocapsa_arctica.AAC.1